MSNSIAIYNAQFCLITKRGNNLFFKSADGKDYSVDCRQNKNNVLSDDLPKTVPGNNKKQKVTIKPEAPLGEYDFEVTLKTKPKGGSGIGTTPPTMIIRVE